MTSQAQAKKNRGAKQVRIGPVVAVVKAVKAQGLRLRDRESCLRSLGNCLMANHTNSIDETLNNSAEGRPNTDKDDSTGNSSTPPSSSRIPSPIFAIDAKEMEVEECTHKGEGEECAIKTTKGAG